MDKVIVGIILVGILFTGFLVYATQESVKEHIEACNKVGGVSVYNGEFRECLTVKR